MIKTIRNNLVAAGAAIAFVVGLSLNTGPAFADTTPGCGADNQKVCTTSKAKYHGKVKKKKPKQGMSTKENFVQLPLVLVSIPVLVS